MTITVERQWLNFYSDEIPATLTYEDKAIHDYLKEAADVVPNKTALHFLGKKMSYAEVDTLAKKFAYQLTRLGVKKGDRVALVLANTPQSVICYYGALMIGAVVVQTNPLYVEREMEHQLVDSEARVVVCLDLVYPKVAKVRDKTKVTHVIVTSIKDFLPFPKNVLYPLIQKKNKQTKINIAYDATTLKLMECLKSSSEQLPDVSIDPNEDLALLQYTGGTTGPAKGVMLTHKNIVVNTTQCVHWMHKMKKGEEVFLAALPFFHVYGLTVIMNLAIMYQSKMIILPRFEPLDVLKSIEKHKVTIFPGAPTMYIGLINHPLIKEYDLSSVEICLSGAAPLPLEVQQRFESLSGGKLVEGYGLTEASPVAIATPIWGERKAGSIGIPWPDTDVAFISTETGEMVNLGEIGELAIRGPQIMKGYWKRPEETRAAFKDEWLLTGDIGYMDEDGYCYIIDRKKDVIIASGFNIYPREIEEILYEHEAIQEAAIVGVSDEYRGETVKAFIVLKEGYTLTEKELDGYCRKTLAPYKVPKQYEFRTELPKTLVGKVLRRILIAEEEQKSSKQ